MLQWNKSNPQPEGSKLHADRKADLEDSCSACNLPALHGEDGGFSWQPEACNVQARSDKAPRVVAQVQNEGITSTLLHSLKTHGNQAREAERRRPSCDDTLLRQSVKGQSTRCGQTVPCQKVAHAEMHNSWWMKALAADTAVELTDYQHQGARCFGDTHANREEVYKHRWVVYLQICNGMSHLWGSLLAEVDQADVTCHMVPMPHGCAEHRVQFQLLSLQLHLQVSHGTNLVQMSKQQQMKCMWKWGFPTLY